MEAILSDQTPKQQMSNYRSRLFILSVKATIEDVRVARGRYRYGFRLICLHHQIEGMRHGK